MSFLWLFLLAGVAGAETNPFGDDGTKAVRKKKVKPLVIYDPFRSILMNVGIGSGPSYGGTAGVRFGAGYWHNQVSLGLGIAGVHAGYRLQPGALAVFDKVIFMPFVEAGYGPAMDSSAEGDRYDPTMMWGSLGGYHQAGVHLTAGPADDGEAGGIFSCLTFGVTFHANSDSLTFSIGWELVGGSD